MGFMQSLWQESRPNIGIGEEEHEGKSGKEGKAELLPRAVTWKRWDAPELSQRIRQPREGGGIPAVSQQSSFPFSLPADFLTSSFNPRPGMGVFFPRFGRKNPSKSKPLSAVQMVF